MDTCWQILGIEENCDSDNIRKAYLSLLPQFHPETDPDGFKRLRNAYETALLLSQKQRVRHHGERYSQPQHVKEIKALFEKLLRSPQRRFQQDAWQQFIAELNKYPPDAINDIRWSLFWTVQEELDTLSLSCLKLLYQRLDWGWEGIAKQSPDLWEIAEALREQIDEGDLFDYSQLSAMPLTVQNYIIREYKALTEAVIISPASAEEALSMHRVLPVPADEKLIESIFFCYSHYNEGVFLAVDEMMQQWPGNAGYHFLLTLWQWYRTDGCKKLLLWWFYRHSPLHVPLMILALDVYCYPREDIAPGRYKKTKILCQWALKWMNGLALPAQYLVKQILSGASLPAIKKTFGKRMNMQPLWPLYLGAERLIQGYYPDDKCLKELEHDPLTVMILEAMALQVKELSRYEALPPRYESPSPEYKESMATAKAVFVLSLIAVIIALLTVVGPK